MTKEENKFYETDLLHVWELHMSASEEWQHRHAQFRLEYIRTSIEFAKLRELDRIAGKLETLIGVKGTL